MNSLYWLAGSLLFLTVFAFTNPDEYAHKNKVREVLIGNANAHFGAGSQDGAEVLIQTFAERAATNMINEAVSVDNYYLFSVTKVTSDDKSRSVGVGLLGKVFLTEKFNPE